MHVCLCQQLFGKETAPECATSMAFHGCLDNDHARQLSNWCDICKVAKVVHRNWSDNNCNRSDTLPSINTTTRALLLYWQIPCSLPHLEHTHTMHSVRLSLCRIFFSFFSSSFNRRSSEIQGTALGKSLRAWTCISTSVPAGVVQSRHAFIGGTVSTWGKMMDTCKQKYIL